MSTRLAKNGRSFKSLIFSKLNAFVNNRMLRFSKELVDLLGYKKRPQVSTCGVLYGSFIRDYFRRHQVPLKKKSR